MKKKWVTGLSVVIVIGALATVGVMERGKLQQAFSPAVKSKVTVTVQSDDGKVSSMQVRKVQDVIEKEQLRESVEDMFGFQFKEPVTIHLAPDEEHYASLIRDYNVKLLKGKQYDPYYLQWAVNRLAKTSSGEDLGNDIFLDVSGLDSEPLLRGTVMGELSMVMLEQNKVCLPIWFEEGLVTHVMVEQEYQEDPDSLESYKQQCMTSILNSKQAGKDMELRTSGSRVITDEYDFRALEWLATEDVLQNQGANKIKQYLHDSLSTSKVVDPFTDDLGIDESIFKINFFAKLDEVAKKNTSM